MVDDDRATCGEDAGAHGGTLPGRAVVADVANAAVALGNALGEHRAGAVGRAVVDDQHLIVSGRKRCVDLADQKGEVFGFVAAGMTTEMAG